MNDFINTLSEEQKKVLLNALLDNSPTLESVPQTTKQESIKHIQSSVPTASTNDDFVMKRQDNSSNVRRKEAVRARKNEWVDTGEFHDIETPKGDRTPRKRPPHKKLEVECHVCGKTFKEDPRYVHGEYYRCNRCTGR
jgi:lipopolysaccharide export LptBFGC system permease protein LptF